MFCYRRKFSQLRKTVTTEKSLTKRENFHNGVKFLKWEKVLTMVETCVSRIKRKNLPYKVIVTFFANGLDFVKTIFLVISR